MTVQPLTSASLCLSGRVRARPRHHLRLLRQRGLHEHRHPALRCDALRCHHHDQPGREVLDGQPAAEEGPARDPRGARLPYVATASIAYPADVMQKVEKAMNTEGPKYVQVHAPCCTGWGFDGAKTLAIGKLAIETGLWVNYEMDDGDVPKVKKVVKKPVEEYPRTKRFRHLQADGPGRESRRSRR